MTSVPTLRPFPFIIFTLTFILTCTFYPPALTADESDVFAIVNGKEIPMTAFETSFNFLKISSSMFHDSDSEKKLARLENRAIDIVLNREILLQDAQAKGVSPTEDEIRAFLERDKLKFGKESKLVEFLKRGGITLEDYQEMMASIYRVRFYIENYINKQVNITDSQCRRYYEDNVQTYSPPPQVYVSTRTFTLPDLSDMTAIARIRDLSSLRDHMDIVTRSNRIVRTSASRIEVKQQTGLRISPELHPELWSIADSLEVDTATYIKVDEYSHMIVFLNRKDFFEQKLFEDVSEEIREILLNEGLKRFAGENLDKLREKAKIEILHERQHP